MRDSVIADAHLVPDLVLILRHDGNGGVVDDLTEPGELTGWVRAHPDTPPVAPHFVADGNHLTAVRDLRTAVRTLFAHAASPAEPSPADASSLLSLPEALRRLNDAAARTPHSPRPGVVRRARPRRTPTPRPGRRTRPDRRTRPGLDRLPRRSRPCAPVTPPAACATS
ncbi:ABATE domain-containing protein [Streptomyces pimonensis]|uniref:ABATE domain-containing protein n=1 Tax=Streptomyces pimonensis TaxID=2860288 RepID=UPI0035275914